MEILCVSGETGWEKLHIKAGGRAQRVRPATAPPAGETSARRTQGQGDAPDTKHNSLFSLLIHFPLK